MPMLRTQAQRARFTRGSYRGSSLAGPTRRWQAPGLSGAWIETASQVARGGDPVSAPQLLVLPVLALVPDSPGLWCQGRRFGGGPGPPWCVDLPPCPTPRGAPGPGRGVWGLDLGCEGPQLQKRSEKATTSPSAPPSWKGAILAGSRADVTDGDSWWAGAAEVSGAVAVLIAPWVTGDAAQGDEPSRRRAARPGSLSSEQPLVFSS